VARERKELTHLERLIGQAIGQERALGREDDPAREKYPHLWEWLTTIYVGQDYIKSPATIRIAMGPDGPLITLSDADLAIGMDTHCASLEGILDHLEAELGQPAPPFKPYNKKQPTLRKRKKITGN